MCREDQTALFGTILASPLPTALGVHGPPSSGKSLTLSRYLESEGLSFSLVRCDQCSTTRILLQRALRSILLQTETGGVDEAVAENVEAFSNVLSAAFSAKQFFSPHILILDRIDRLPDSSVEIFSCLSRLPEFYGITNLTTVFVYSTPESKQLISSPVPHVYFPAYTLEETISIVGSMSPPTLLPFDGDSNSYWREFVRVAVLALNPYTGTDILLVKRTCQRLWPQFIENAVPNFNKQYLTKQKLFQSEDFIKQLDSSKDDGLCAVQKYLLIAAYLASYNDSRYDVRFFSRAKEAHAKRRDTKPRVLVQIPARSLAPPTFEFERWLAIFHALIPDPASFVPSIEVGMHISTLTAQNMVVLSQEDPLDSRTKWRINTSWGFIESIAKDVNLYIEDYILE